MPLVGSQSTLATAMKSALASALNAEDEEEGTITDQLRADFLDTEEAAAVDNEALTALCDILTNHIVSRILPKVCDALAPVIVSHIASNTIVSPLGLPVPMSNSGGPVAGTGKLE